MTSSAPSVRSLSAFSSLPVVAITRAPKLFANCKAKSETPPDPSVNTVSPARKPRPPVRAFHAVTPAQGPAELRRELGRPAPVDPVREDRRGHAIADRDPRHSLPDLDDFASSVG